MAIVMTAEDSIGAPKGVVRVVHRCEDAMVNQRLVSSFEAHLIAKRRRKVHERNDLNVEFNLLVQRYIRQGCASDVLAIKVGPESNPKNLNLLLRHASFRIGAKVACHRLVSAGDDLSACFLASFPDAIFMLMRNTQLESLDLSQNVIRKIPSKVPRKFTGITSLNLASNRLFNLPDEISELENLTHLDLSGNDFTSVPWCLYRMPQLRFLNLSNNHIVDVDIAGLKRLDCEIHLENNPLTSACCAQLAEETLPRVSYIPLKQEE